MRYLSKEAARLHRVSLDVPNIHHTGSVQGMQKLYGWPRAGQVRSGQYIYNIGPREVARLKAAGAL